MKSTRYNLYRYIIILESEEEKNKSWYPFASSHIRELIELLQILWCIDVHSDFNNEIYTLHIVQCTTVSQSIQSIHGDEREREREIRKKKKK